MCPHIHLGSLYLGICSCCLSTPSRRLFATSWTTQEPPLFCSQGCDVHFSQESRSWTFTGKRVVFTSAAKKVEKKKTKAFIINWNIHWRNCSYTPRVPYSSLEISNKNSFLLTAFISGHSSYLSKDELIVYLHSREMFMYPCTDAAVYPCPPEHIVRYSPFFFSFYWTSSGLSFPWLFPTFQYLWLQHSCL